MATVHETLCMTKGKAIPQHNYGGTQGERMYSSYSFHVTWVPCHPCPDTEDSCEYIEKAVADSRQGVALQLGSWAGANNPHRKSDICCDVCTRASEMEGFSGMTQALEKEYEIWHVECQEPV
jgi:hypothetical protein